MRQGTISHTKVLLKRLTMHFTDSLKETIVFLGSLEYCVSAILAKAQEREFISTFVSGAFV